MSDIRYFYNEHGVLCCDKTVRTDAADTLTLMRLRGAPVLITRNAMFPWPGPRLWVDGVRTIPYEGEINS